MATKRLPQKTKIYVASDEGDLRRIWRPDGISFTATIMQERESDGLPLSIAVELQFTKQLGTVLITMRRTARRPDSWYCNTSSIRLPPRAATDLIQSLTSMKKRLNP